MVVILKPTLRCNLSCRHCYVGDNFTQKNLSEDQFFYILKTIPQGSEVIIHGGEPTLMGSEYYERILPQFNHKYAIQSNITLIDKKWIRVLKEIFKGRISSSFDVIGDMRNVDRTLWIERVKFLKENGINPYIICVLNKQNQDSWDKIYEFFNYHNLSFRLNYIINAGRSQKNYKKLRHDKGKYGQALINIFNKWFLKSHIIVDPLMEIIEALLLGNSLSKCPFTSKCAVHFISINPDGEVIPCGGFECFGVTYGNIFTHRWLEILNSENRRKATERIYNPPLPCEDCNWLYLCGGGCRLESLSSKGDWNNVFSVCEELKHVFSHIENQIDKNSDTVYNWYVSVMDHNLCNFS